MDKIGILMVTSEVVPLAKSGGLADMVGALSEELKNQGQDVRIVMPRYKSIKKENLSLRGAMTVAMGYGDEKCQVYETVLPATTIPVYLIDHDHLMARDGIYGSAASSAYGDNAQRFAFFSQAVFQLCLFLRWIPEILHCHDWIAGPVPMLLKARERLGDFPSTSSIFTIHNQGYQGIFDLESCELFSLPVKKIEEHFGIHNQQLNFLKMGIENAEIISTVSSTYAEEIKTASLGYGLDGSLRYRKSDLFGILNGVEYNIWNPEKDSYLSPYNFSIHKMRNKQKLKTQLQKKMGLEENPDIPLIGMVTRLVDQKGVGDLCGPTHGKLYDMLWDMDVQMVILGTGETWCEEELRKLDHALENLKVEISYSDELAHLIEGASDFFLMPSKYEPCGLNQIYSLRYGTLPIVRRTGGLADTVSNYQEKTGEGTGFIFDDLTPKAIYNAIGWAVSTWYDRPHHIKKMRKEAMKQRFSWEKSALKYRELYKWSQDRIGLKK